MDTEGHLHFWFPGFDHIVKYATGPGLDSLARVAEPTIPPDPRMSYRTEDSALPWNSAGPGARPEAILEGVQLDREPPRLEGQERDSVAAAAGIPARRLPAHKYALQNIRSGPDGWVWVETERGPTRGWEVFDERGYYLGRVASPVPIEKQPAPFFGSGMVTGVTLGELDVPYVVQLRIVRGG